MKTKTDCPCCGKPMFLQEVPLNEPGAREGETKLEFVCRVENCPICVVK